MMLRFTTLSAILFVVGWLVRLNAPQSLLGGREQRDDITVVTLKVDWATPD